MATTVMTVPTAALSREHRANIQRIVLFVILYRISQGMGVQIFKNPEVPVDQRDGTTHEMLFEFLVHTRPYKGEDWKLIVQNPDIAADVVRHIENEAYAGKSAIVAKWRELCAIS